MKIIRWFLEIQSSEFIHEQMLPKPSICYIASLPRLLRKDRECVGVGWVEFTLTTQILINALVLPFFEGFQIAIRTGNFPIVYLHHLFARGRSNNRFSYINKFIPHLLSHG